jgi:WD40 repeat protein
MMEEEEKKSVKVFCCYARKDKRLQEKLMKHLSALQRQGLIEVWYDGKIDPGMPWEQEIKNALQSAQIILLLVSSDFIASNYCWEVELQRTMERHERGEAEIVPILLSPCFWKELPFAKLQMLPTGAKPVTLWPDRDRALLDVTEGVNKVAQKLATLHQELEQQTPSQEDGQDMSSSTIPTKQKGKRTRRAFLIGGIATIAGLGALGFWELKSRETSVHADPLPLQSGLGISIPGSIYSVAASPNGKQIAATSNQGTVYICDATTGKLVQIYIQQPPMRIDKTHVRFFSINHVSWSPNGQHIASGDDKHQVHVWDATTGRTRFVYSGHTDKVLNVAWSPSGERIASAGADSDGTVQLWDAYTGNNKFVYDGHIENSVTKAVTALTWSPDGQQVASGGSDKTVQVWDATRGSLHYTLPHPDFVNAVSWSPNGQWIASACNDYYVRSWSASSRPEKPDVYAGHTFWVRTVAWSFDSQWIASGSYDKTIRIWNTHTKETLYISMANTTEGGVDAVIWLSNKKQIVAGTEGAIVQIWNISASQ